jgi:hypothetical protein
VDAHPFTGDEKLARRSVAVKVGDKVRRCGDDGEVAEVRPSGMVVVQFTDYELWTYADTLTIIEEAPTC